MANILRLKQCETCQGAGQLMQDTGKMKGYIIPCMDCAGNWKDWSNQYGTLEEDGPTIYVDQQAGIVEQVKEDRGDYLKLLDGTEILLTKSPWLKKMEEQNLKNL